MNNAFEMRSDFFGGTNNDPDVLKAIFVQYLLNT